jgi:DNA-binding response OmpR family regulator
VKVLVAEDDRKLGLFLQRVLAEEGFTVDHSTSGADALSQARSGVYDLLVLDWMLPDGDGLGVCRQLRREGSTLAILMLTARGELAERVLGLGAGADDYLVKPFDVEELVARVHALLRRAAGHRRLELGPLCLDQIAHQAVLAGRPLDLTHREFAILIHLAQRRDQIVSRSDLLAHVWSTQFDPESNVVDVQMSRIRDKLGEHAWMIDTVRGRGYRLRAERPR